MKIVYLISILVLGACGSHYKTNNTVNDSDKKPVLSEPNKLNAYKAKYKQIMAEAGILADFSKVTITVGTITDARFPNDKILGVCYAGGILKLDPDYDEVVFYHELGHCMFTLPHTNDPEDIMYYERSDLNSEITEENLQRYINQIKDRLQKTLVGEQSRYDGLSLEQSNESLCSYPDSQGTDY